MNWKAPVLVVISVLLIAILIVGGVFYYKSHVTINANTANINSNVLNLSGKIAFLKNGDVWVADRDGSNSLQLTNASSTIADYSGGETFSFSPDFHYLEYYTGWPTGTRDYSSGTINILDLHNNKVVKKIDGLTFNQFVTEAKSMSEIPWVQFQDWINDQQFITTGSASSQGPGGETDPAGQVLVDLQEATTTLLNRGYDFRVVEDYFGIINSSTSDPLNYTITNMSYPSVYYIYTPTASSSNASFHLFNASTEQDKILGSWNISGGGQLSPNHTLSNVAFVKSNAVWLYNNGTTLKLFESTSTPLWYDPYSSSLVWSPDDNFLAFRFDESSQLPGRIILVNVSNSLNPKIEATVDTGHGYSPMDWISNEEIIFQKDNDMYIFNLPLQSITLFSASSSDPIVIK